MHVQQPFDLPLSQRRPHREPTRHHGRFGPLEASGYVLLLSSNLMANAFLLSLLGGVLIGLSATLLLLFNGRVAGISGIASGLVTPARGDVGWRVAFMGGLALGGVLLSFVLPGALGAPVVPGAGAAILAGLLVGFGARLGGGCTSGHGICGVARGATRSLVATAIFIAAGALTVFVVRHLLGGAS